MINKYLAFFCACFLCISCYGNATSERIYVDKEDINSTDNFFHIHIGHNLWIQNHTLHRDPSGMYTFESDIAHGWDIETMQLAYEKTWKCPYCHHFWPLKQRCQNPDCPSKYLF